MNASYATRFGSAVLAAALLCSLPVFAGSRIEKELDLAPGGQFALDTDQGSVTVVGSSSGGVRIVITAKKDDIESYFDIEFDQGPGKVEVSVDKKGSKLTKWFKRSPGVEFKIEVPRETALHIDTSGGAIKVDGITGPAELDTSGGSIEVNDLHGEVNADTSGGGIRLSNIEGDIHADTSGGGITVDGARGNVTADTSGGSIRMVAVGGDIQAETSGGSITITEAAGHVNAETSGGPVEVGFTEGNASGGRLSTSGGRVTAYLDPTVGLEIDASTSGGSVKLDIPLTVRGTISKSAVQGTLGEGGAQLTLRSSGGSIRIAPR